MEIDGTAEQLVADGFLVYDTSSEQYSVTEAGKQYLVKYDTYGMDEIRKGNLSFAVLRFFSELDGGLETEFLPKSFSENAPKNGNNYPELNLLNFLDFKMNQFIGKNRSNKYEINSAGRLQYEYEMEQRLDEIKNMNGIAASAGIEMVSMSLENTCELIFTKHKENNGSLRWHKSTFGNTIPNNTDTAKDVMLHENVLLLSSSRERTTILNPAVANCNSYSEAKEILKEKEYRERQIRDLTIQEKTTTVVNQMKEFNYKKWGVIIAALLAILALLKFLGSYNSSGLKGN